MLHRAVTTELPILACYLLQTMQSLPLSYLLLEQVSIPDTFRYESYRKIEISFVSIGGSLFECTMLCPAVQWNLIQLVNGARVIAALWGSCQSVQLLPAPFVRIVFLCVSLGTGGAGAEHRAWSCNGWAAVRVANIYWSSYSISLIML